jgi:signal peptidase I
MIKKTLSYLSSSFHKNFLMPEGVKTLVYALLIAGIIRSFLFEPFHIPSGSMKNGLLEGDFLISSKYSYGYSKYSFPFGMVPIKDRVFSNIPERGDVIIFRPPATPNINYIKRLIGLPGDEIQMINSELILNGKKVQRVEIEPYKYNDEFYISRYRETLPNGKSYDVLDMIPDGLKDNTPKYVVPQGHYFFMGDNRDNSQDSRYLGEVGYVPHKNLVAKARFIFMSKDGSLLKVWEWFTKIRFSRIFTTIE